MINYRLAFFFRFCALQKKSFCFVQCNTSMRPIVCRHRLYRCFSCCPCACHCCCHECKCVVTFCALLRCKQFPHALLHTSQLPVFSARILFHEDYETSRRHFYIYSIRVLHLPECLSQILSQKNFIRVLCSFIAFGRAVCPTRLLCTELAADHRSDVAFLREPDALSHFPRSLMQSTLSPARERNAPVIASPKQNYQKQ